MNRILGFILWIVFPALTLNSCQNTIPETKQQNILHKEKTHLKYSIQDTPDGKILTVYQPYPGAQDLKYFLSNTKNQNTPEDWTFIRIPVESYIPTSVTHLQMLKKLGVLNRMKGFPHIDYISDTSIIRFMEQNKIPDIGSENHLDKEVILKLNPQILFVFSTGSDGKNFSFFQDNGIVPVFISEWTETDPLNRASWIRVFGVLFEKENLADSIFLNIATKYNSLKKKYTDRLNKPKIFQGGKYGDKWFVPGGKSWAAKLIEDAGGEYLIQNDQSNSIIISQEDALLLLSQADIWLNPGNWKSREEVINNFPQAKNLKVFQSGQIYSAYIKTNSAGKNEFFEKSVLQPHFLLEDYMKIFHDTLKSNLYFMEKLSGFSD